MTDHICTVRRCPACTGTATDEGHAADFTGQSDKRCDDNFPRRYRTATIGEAAVTDWADRAQLALEAAPSLLLLGRTGVGKTHNAYAALRVAVRQSWLVRWEALTAADLYASLRPGGSPLGTEKRLHDIRTAHVLLIDDLGAVKNSEWVEEVTYRVLNGRYERMMPTIITTNLDPEQLRDTVGDRIASRLVEMCEIVVVGGLEGADRRRLKAVA